MGVLFGPYPVHEVRLRFDVLGRQVSNVYHIGELDPGVVKRQAIDLGQVILDWFQHDGPLGESARSLMGFDAVLLRAVVSYADIVLDVPVIGNILDIVLAGLAADACTAQSLSYALEWTTGYRGPAGHGRTFLAGLPVGAFESGHEDRLTMDYLDKVLSAYAMLPEALQRCTRPTGGVCLALRHVRPRPVAIGPSRDWSPVTGVRLPKQRVGVMARRLAHDRAVGVGSRSVVGGG